MICLIESPYKQEGKCNIEGLNQATLFVTLMKVPPKRKGNSIPPMAELQSYALNESPSEKEGKSITTTRKRFTTSPSMKVPPKRKGNSPEPPSQKAPAALNESPSEKEGKCRVLPCCGACLRSLNESPSEKEGKFGACKIAGVSEDNPQ